MYIVDKDAKSFIDIDINSDFSIQNLPYGVFQTQEEIDPLESLSVT